MADVDFMNNNNNNNMIKNKNNCINRQYAP